MRKFLVLLMAAVLLLPVSAKAEASVYRLQLAEGTVLTDVCTDVDTGDQYISADNRSYEVVRVEGNIAIVEDRGAVSLPSLDWMDADDAVAVMAMTRSIALYCTHSDESYEPSDGAYSTTERGSIYQVAAALADSLSARGVQAAVADTLHHPHDAGAYRRSRQTAVQLIKEMTPDCIIDVHRDGIPDPASYAVTIGGEPASKIRLLVGRGNQNAELNKEFALLLKAVGDRVYPGLIKDIYLGKGTFNQDLLPRAILLECGTYTLEKERVLTSMPMMADVLNRALYGGIVGSAGRTTADTGNAPEATGGITMGAPDAPASAEESKGIGSGLIFLVGIVMVGVGLIAFLSAGSFKGGVRKLGRNLSEMTGGIIGTRPKEEEDHDHS